MCNAPKFGKHEERTGLLLLNLFISYGFVMLVMSQRLYTLNGILFQVLVVAIWKETKWWNIKREMTLMMNMMRYTFQV